MEQKPAAISPLQVKPTIKLARWVCLVSGIVYGIVKRQKYAAIEKVLRDEEERERPAREARLRCEKLRRDAAELRELERIFLGTSSADSEETFDEIPCDENITSKDNNLALSDKKEETNGNEVISNDNEVISNDNEVISNNDESQEAITPLDEE